MESADANSETKDGKQNNHNRKRSVTESGLEILKGILKKDLESLQKATKISMKDVKSRAQRLMSQVQKMNGHYSRVVEITNKPDDTFNTRISDFLAEASKSVQSLSTKIKRMDQEYYFTVQYFTGHSQKKCEATASEAFFGNVSSL